MPWVSEGPAGRRGSEAALGQPVAAAQPHDGHPALPPPPALPGPLRRHGHHPLGHLGRCPPASSRQELLLPPGTSQALIPVQIPPYSPGNHLVFNPDLLFSFRPDLNGLLSSPESGPCSCTPSAPLSPPTSPACLAPQDSGSWNTSLIESPPINPFAESTGSSLQYIIVSKPLRLRVFLQTLLITKVRRIFLFVCLFFKSIRQHVKVGRGERRGQNLLQGIIMK